VVKVGYTYIQIYIKSWAIIVYIFALKKVLMWQGFLTRMLYAYKEKCLKLLHDTG